MGIKSSRVDAVALQRYARIAGFLFIFYIVIAMAGSFLVASFQVRGNFVQTAANIRAAEITYRTGLLMQLAGDMTAIALGWALYVLLKPIDHAFALLGMLWRVAEGVIGAVGTALGWTTLTLYTSQAPGDASSSQEALASLAESVSKAIFPIGVTFFSFGSLIFFLLLLRSRFIPRWLALTGAVGSICATLLGFMLLIAPAAPPAVQLLWLPLFVAEIGVGILFLTRGANLIWLEKKPESA